MADHLIRIRPAPLPEFICLEASPRSLFNFLLLIGVQGNIAELAETGKLMLPLTPLATQIVGLSPTIVAVVAAVLDLSALLRAADAVQRARFRDSQKVCAVQGARAPVCATGTPQLAETATQPLGARVRIEDASNTPEGTILWSPSAEALPTTVVAGVPIPVHVLAALPCRFAARVADVPPQSRN